MYHSKTPESSGVSFYRQKKSQLFVETYIFYLFQPLAWFRLQFLFVFHRIQSLQLLPPIHPCTYFRMTSAFHSTVARFLSAFFLLSFHFLSSASVLDSDYSASVSSFPFFLLPPHSGFFSARLQLSPLTSSPLTLT